MENVLFYIFSIPLDRNICFSTQFMRAKHRTFIFYAALIQLLVRKKYYDILKFRSLREDFTECAIPYP